MTRQALLLMAVLSRTRDGDGWGFEGKESRTALVV
jgi:hypothetical protein